MNSDSEDNILLNLTQSCTEVSKTVGIKCKRKNSDAKNYGSKKTKQARSDSKSTRGFVKASERSSRTKLTSDKNADHENPEKFQVISSLFRKNPDLPDISSDVLEAKSNVMMDDETFCTSEFKHTNLAPFMVSNLEKNLHFNKMTSVQKASLPLLLNGKDVFIKSPTGTGKTLAYVIPVVQSLQAILPRIQRVDGPYCLVLVPTRELASQTLTVIQEVLKPFIWIVPGSVTGGEKRKSEKARLRKGINILVATPGRLVDHLKTTKCLTMSKLMWLVLDEADRLLELGFEQDLSFILSTIKNQTSRKIQKVLLSATLSHGVENLLDVNFENPASVNMMDEGNSKLEQEQYCTPNLLEQFCVVVPMKLRLVTLAAFLQQQYEKNCKIIVFCTTQDSVDFHFMLYSSTLTTTKGEKINFMKLHGKLSQSDRVRVFSVFKESESGILVCTDIAARGLDLPSVNWIVQYNPPVSTADYVHRVGRTARIGTSGQALLFLLPTEVAFLNFLSEQNIRLHELKMNDILTSFVRTLSAKLPKSLSEECLHSQITEQHMKFEENVSQNKDMKQLGLTAFRSFIGAYNTFPASLKHIFHPRNLHLGHLAKSFALRETPSELKQTSTKTKLQIVERTCKYSRTFSVQCPKSASAKRLSKKMKKR